MTKIVITTTPWYRSYAQRVAQRAYENDVATDILLRPFRPTTLGRVAAQQHPNTVPAIVAVVLGCVSLLAVWVLG